MVKTQCKAVLRHIYLLLRVDYFITTFFPKVGVRYELLAEFLWSHFIELAIRTLPKCAFRAFNMLYDDIIFWECFTADAAYKRTLESLQLKCLFVRLTLVTWTRSSQSLSSFIIIPRPKIEVSPDTAKLADWTKEGSLDLVKIVAHTIRSNQEFRFFWFYCQLDLTDYQIAEFYVH